LCMTPQTSTIQASLVLARSPIEERIGMPALGICHDLRGTRPGAGEPAAEIGQSQNETPALPLLGAAIEVTGAEVHGLQPKA
jgi:hypothetical protein